MRQNRNKMQNYNRIDKREMMRSIPELGGSERFQLFISAFDDSVFHDWLQMELANIQDVQSVQYDRRMNNPSQRENTFTELSKFAEKDNRITKEAINALFTGNVEEAYMNTPCETTKKKLESTFCAIRTM